ncbi:hypothetical protein BsWGS_24237 [Bradybaena similaris]
MYCPPGFSAYTQQECIVPQPFQLIHNRNVLSPSLFSLYTTGMYCPPAFSDYTQQECIVPQPFQLIHNMNVLSPSRFSLHTTGMYCPPGFSAYTQQECIVPQPFQLIHNRNVLSPSLFSLYTTGMYCPPAFSADTQQDIFKQAEELARLSINGRLINNLRYADDTILLAENGQDFRHLVDQVKRNSTDCRMWKIHY